MKTRVLTLAALLIGTTALADEIVLQNDSLVDGGSVNICPCFAQNEEAAVWLTSPCAGNIVGIQIFWRSFFGGSGQVVEDSINIYRGGTFPVPGTLKKELLAPVLTDGGLNVFRYEDQDQTIPISIPVTAGETFVVSLRFFESNVNNFSHGTVVSDDSGCQPGKNAVKVNGVTWTNACSLGVSGDWVIRAIVECNSDPTGAVCLPDGGCADGLTQDEAIALGGQFRGAGTECADVTCVGACYIPSNGNCLQFDFDTCSGVGGQWQGPGTTDCVGCVADINGDGVLNFFDVSAFISLYNSQNPDADLAAPFGVFNFFDVAEYISAYNDGCP